MSEFQRFPKKGKLALPRLREMTSRERREGHDYSWRLNKPLCSLALRFLYARDRTAVGLSKEAQEALEDFLRATLAAAPHVAVYDDRVAGAAAEKKRHHLPMSRVVGKVVEWCAENFDGPAMQARARKGGQRSTRRKVRPVDLIPLEGMSKPEQAARLGIAVSTVGILRRELAELQRTQEEKALTFDDLLAPTHTNNRVVSVQVTNGPGHTYSYTSPGGEGQQGSASSDELAQDTEDHVLTEQKTEAQDTEDHVLTSEEIDALMAPDITPSKPFAIEDQVAQDRRHALFALVDEIARSHGSGSL